MPTRKRKRTRLNPGPIIVLALIVVLVSGMLYSPITSLSKYEVVGAHDIDKVRMESIVSRLKGVPWVKVNGKQVESEVMQIQGVESSEYSQNIFGRGRLTVKYRTPVALIRANRKIGLDTRGVVFETDSLPTGLPTVVRPESASLLPLTVAGAFPSRTVAEVAVKAQGMFPKKTVTVWFNRKGALCVNLDKAQVVLGAADEIDKKLKALKEILDQEPDLLDKLESLNLTEPTHPAKTYKKQRE